MALSDTCFDAITELNRAFHDSVDWNYRIEHLSKLASAMLELAELAFDIVQTPDLEESYVMIHGAPKSIKLIAECYVVGELIADPNTHQVYKKAVEVVAQIAAVNPEICAAIVNGYKWQASQAGISEKLRMDDVISLEAIYRTVCSV